MSAIEMREGFTLIYKGEGYISIAAAHRATGDSKYYIKMNAQFIDEEGNPIKKPKND
jgi:hypothetical protein